MSQLKISDYISVTKTSDNMDGKKVSDRVVDSTITFTFGDAGENHAGMQMIGEKNYQQDKGLLLIICKKLRKILKFMGGNVSFID